MISIDQAVRGQRDISEKDDIAQKLRRNYAENI